MAWDSTKTQTKSKNGFAVDKLQFSLGFPTFPHGFPMVSPWFPHGLTAPRRPPQMRSTAGLRRLWLRCRRPRSWPWRKWKPKRRWGFWEDFWRRPRMFGDFLWWFLEIHKLGNPGPRNRIFGDVLLWWWTWRSKKVGKVEESRGQTLGAKMPNLLY